MLVVLPPVTVTLVRYSWYPVLVSLSWCDPADTPVRVSGESPLNPPSQKTLAPDGVEVTPIIPVPFAKGAGMGVTSGVGFEVAADPD